MNAPRGALLAVLAAAAFGASSPLVKRLGGDMPALVVSGLLYLGCGMAMAIVGFARATPHEARLRGSDYAWLAAGIATGGVLAPLFLVLGLARTTASAASLLLNAELVLTLLVAALFFREAVGRRVAIAAVLVAAGAAALSVEPALAAAPAPALGGALVLLACLCWAVENNLTCRIAHRDPFAIVRWKGLVAGPISLGLAAATGGLAAPAIGTAAALLAVGAVSFGASIVLYTYAQRALGAARTAAYYGLAPFLGVVLAVALGDPLTIEMGLAAAVMAGAAWLLFSERHAHRHVHEPFVHEHRHMHDEHHRHEHAGDEGPEPHTHPHRHEEIEHDHEHAPDRHHRHRHEA